MTATMNVHLVAVTQTVHFTSAELSTLGQHRVSTLCSKRLVTGYTTAPGTQTVNCPKCLAKV